MISVVSIKGFELRSYLGGFSLKRSRFISSLIMQWRKTDFRYVESLDDALAILARVDTTLEQAPS